jgi:CDP-diacylglycerol--serine O-phosphatidyltransferase
VLWAFLADHIDGVVAQRTAGRSQQTREIGRHLDSLADLVCECVIPGLILLVVNHYALSSLAIATASIVVGALRLSYYNAFGARDGYFIGVPVTYVVPVLATVFLLSPLLGADRLGPALNVALCVLLLLHLSSIRVPVTKGWMMDVRTCHHFRPWCVRGADRAPPAAEHPEMAKCDLRQRLTEPLSAMGPG